jgi:hypothetical protein
MVVVHFYLLSKWSGSIVVVFNIPAPGRQVCHLAENDDRYKFLGQPNKTMRCRVVLPALLARVAAVSGRRKSFHPAIANDPVEIAT